MTVLFEIGDILTNLCSILLNLIIETNFHNKFEWKFISMANLLWELDADVSASCSHSKEIKFEKSGQNKRIYIDVIAE